MKLLVHTGVTRYLEFKSIEGSYVYKAGKKEVQKVPADEKEALTTCKSKPQGFPQAVKGYWERGTANT